MTIPGFLLCVSGLALFWSFLRYHRVYYAVVDSLPLELRDEHTSHFAFHTIALRRSTPLALQADYVKSYAVACVAPLAMSLSCFMLDNVVAGWGFLILFLMSSAVTIKSWKAYKANFIWRTSQDDEEEQ
jgi:hypothetical protein